ncbi:MAG: acyl carrier protein [Chitinivibrionia bacterium]|nr:acyl carrier protein [Chitinivibrionia bacterium]
MNTASTIRQFIVENFVFEDGGSLAEDTSFLESGIMDSTGVLELVSFIEETFAIAVADEDLVPENLDSIGRVTRYIESRRGE